MHFDAPTLFVATIAANLSMLLLVFALAWIRKRPANQLFAAAFLASQLGFIVYLVFGRTRQAPLLVAALLLLFAFYVLLVAGMRCYFELQPWPRHLVALLAAALVLIPFFTLVLDSYTFRTLSFAILSVVMISSSIRPILHQISNRKHLRLVYLAVLGEQLTILILRIGLFLFTTHPSSSLLDESPMTSLTLLTAIFNLGVWAAGILLLDFSTVIDHMALQNRQLQTTAVTDHLTGLYNRYYMDHQLDFLVETANRYHHPISLILFDLDHFKRVNDQYGHDCGDLILTDLAKLVQASVRDSDLLCRWGGEEFVILMPLTDLDGARVAAEKIRKAVDQYPFPNVHHLTISLGVATYLPNEQKELWFKRADLCLYKAKQNGRNQAIAWQPDDVLPLAMIRIEWQKTWESGHVEIDREHRELVELCNRLIDDSLLHAGAERMKQQYQGLLDHLNQHFDHEERILNTLGYLQLEAHHVAHETLQQQFNELLTHFDSGEVDLTVVFNLVMGRIIIGHLLTEDMRFFSQIRESQRKKQEVST